MSRRGNCWDNAIAESFFSSLKKERIRKRIYRTREIVRADIDQYIATRKGETRTSHDCAGGFAGTHSV